MSHFHITLRLLIASSILVGSASLGGLPTATHAASSCEFGDLEVTLPGDVFGAGSDICDIVDDNLTNNGGGFTGAVRSYANVIANLIIATIVILGLIMVVLGGYFYMTAGGSGDRVSTAKTIIGGALLGIALALATYLILNTINPDIITPPSTLP